MKTAKLPTRARAGAPAAASVEQSLSLAATMREAGQIDLAIEVLAAAWRRNPRDPRLPNDIGLCHLRAGRIADAVGAFEAALRLRPRHGAARVNLAQALLARGDAAGALAALAPAEAGGDVPGPELAKARATALRLLGREAEAIALLDAVLEARPDDVQARIDLGVIHCNRKNFAEGSRHFVAALEADPNHWLALYNLGLALEAQGHVDKARRCFEAALARNPHHLDSLNALGVMHLAADDLPKAEAVFEQLLAIEPDHPARANLANCQFQQGKFRAAADSIERAVARDPANDDFRSAAVYYNITICNWAAVKRHLAACPDLGTRRQRIAPFTILAAEDDPIRQRDRSILWAREILPPVAAPFVAPPPDPGGKIRIGYFSNDIYNHATMHLLSGMLREHDRSRFEVTIFSYGPQIDDAMRRLAIASVDRFLNISASTDAEIVQMARHLELDVAIDLKGHTKHARLGFFAARMAPVQMTYIGFPGTSGAEFFDYAVCDAIVVPPAERAGFTERLVYLPDCYQANDDRREKAQPRSSRADWGLPETATVLCCFNQNYKIGETEFAIWLDALGRHPGAVLWLMESNAVAKENLLSFAAARGIGPDRVIFAAAIPPALHFERLRHADLFVDTFHYNAHTTGSDALWAGVPLLTMAGRQFSARVGASLNAAAGLSGFTTTTPAEYAARLDALIADPAALVAARAHLAADPARLPLFDTVAFTRQIEAGYAMAVGRFRAGLSPADIRVPRA